jgi:hypothetical protein
VRKSVMNNGWFQAARQAAPDRVDLGPEQGRRRADPGSTRERADLLVNI